MPARLAVLILALATVAWTLPLEFAARWWISRHGDPLDKAMAVLRMDSALGWRQREGLRATFLGLPLSTDALGLRNPPGEAAASRTILILGPSSTFGWGVREEETYARRLETLLRGRGQAVRVVNAGEIGFTTWQGLALHRRHFQGTRPDVLIVAYGVNDIDRYRFFVDDPRPDAAALAPGVNRWTVALQNVSGRLKLFHVARRKGLQLVGRAACAAGGGKASAQPVPELRVPPDAFDANLAGFLALARSEGSKPIFVTSAFKLPRFAEVSAPEEKAGRAAMEEGLGAYRASDCAAAAPAFERALRADPRLMEARYYLSACLRARGECAAAGAEFDRARALEPQRIEADIRSYNEAMRAVARREKVPLADAESVLEGGRPELFVDPIHPSAEGHRRLAEALLDLIVRGRLLEGS